LTGTGGEVRKPFTDDIGGGWCELVIPPGGKVYPQAGEAKIGIGHPRCDVVADLAIELDAFFCPECKRNGRVSGAWCAEVIEAAGISAGIKPAGAS
jgi:hypothetical protein